MAADEIVWYTFSFNILYFSLPTSAILYAFF